MNGQITTQDDKIKKLKEALAIQAEKVEALTNFTLGLKFLCCAFCYCTKKKNNFNKIKFVNMFQILFYNLKNTATCFVKTLKQYKFCITSLFYQKFKSNMYT